jgi:FAD/FMN-containing dehydrogenase
MRVPSYDTSLHGWGRFPNSKAKLIPIHDRASHQSLQFDGNYSILPHGLARSYGDSCLNDSQVVLSTLSLDKFIHFDRSAGVMRCEAGVSFAEILSVIVPQGWFLPVTPGTKFVTVGGSIANDIHGKNHHVAGNFGHHVRQFELLRSDGRFLCSPTQNTELYFATIGGLGLTGLILWAEFNLKPIHNPLIVQEVVRYETLDEFFAISSESERDFEYTVSWIDCLSKGRNLGRGHFIRGNHAPVQEQLTIKPPKKLSIPFNAPNWALNSLTLQSFNSTYYWRQPQRKKRFISHYDPFFYPLDSIHDWNRIYGNRGFLQYQCVVPFADGSQAIREILSRISHAKMGSFLAVLKTFGSIPSLGKMSFPRAGVTLALDFPNTGVSLFKLLEELDVITRDARGAVYPAKDARMSKESFAVFFPQFEEFERYIDPQFSSSFIRRVR